jgi:peptide/nickel transport system ATP-binding protein
LKKLVCRNFRRTTFTLKKLKLNKLEIPIYLTNQNFIEYLFHFILSCIMLPLVQIKNLQISFTQENNSVQAVKNISFDIPRGKITALIGESGSGKSVTALSFMQLLPKQAIIQGDMLFSEDGAITQNLANISEDDMRKMRGNKIAMIFQEPMTSLNPVHTCGAQVMESLMLHKGLTKKQAKEAAIALFTKVELPVPAEMIDRYPHQISGGQKQRVMIAMAMSCSPALLIADEPTTALDVRVQKNILQLLKNLQAENDMAILFITHDLSLVANVADEIVVMYKGDIVEKGNAKTVLANPQHNYTKALLSCLPTAKSKGKRLAVIDDFMGEKMTTVKENKEIKIISPSDEVMLKVENLKVYFPSKKNMFGKVLQHYKAVDDVSFEIKKNETLGLVGESGCGKTTLGRAILNLVKPTSGNIFFDGENIANTTPAQMRIIRKNLQIVFQDPYGSLNPRLSIGDAIVEPMTVHGLSTSKNARKEKAIHLLEQVNMPADVFNRYPHQFSGGQRQRICIARALALNPNFLIFDESVSALDVSVQAQVLNLINDLKDEYNFTSIFISHNLSVIHYISDRIMVMNKGKIIESGTADEIIFSPKENYTKELLAAVPGQKLLV